MTHLYAFNYTPSPPLTASNGWTLYSPREEFGRMGVGTRSRAWRFTDINKDYNVRSPTSVWPMVFICNASASLYSSFVPRTRCVLSFPPRSATLHCNMVQSTAASAVYLRSPTYTGLIS